MRIHRRKTTAVAVALAVALAAFQGPLATPAAACSTQPFLGSVCLVAFGFCPVNFFEANGQLLPITDHPVLFGLLGTTYGGDGFWVFALPDLRSRVPIHVGQGTDLSAVALGEAGGTEEVTLTVDQLPAHNHSATLRGTNSKGSREPPAGNVLAKEKHDQYHPGPATVAMGASAIDVENTGGGQPVGIRQPFLGLRYCIAFQGTFPPQP